MHTASVERQVIALAALILIHWYFVSIHKDLAICINLLVPTEEEHGFGVVDVDPLDWALIGIKPTTSVHP